MINPYKALAELVDLNVKNRKQSMSMAYSVLKKQYGGALFGWAWSIVKPIVFILIYWFGISVGIRGGKPVELPDGQTVSYLFWMMPGIIAWFFFQETLSHGVSCVRKQNHLVTRMVFPVGTIPVFSVMSYFCTHLVLVGLVTAVFLLFGPGLTIYFVQMIFYLLYFFIFCCIVAMFISTIAVISRDFEQMVKAVMNVFFWLTPVLWQEDRIKSVAFSTVLRLNPFFFFVQGYRDSYLGTGWFFERPFQTLYVLTFTLLLALLTAAMYKKLAPEFADVL